MKLIISDTTALIILSKTNNLQLLTNFIDVVYVPNAVMEEIEFKDDRVKNVRKHRKIDAGQALYLLNNWWLTVLVEAQPSWRLSYSPTLYLLPVFIYDFIATKSYNLSRSVVPGSRRRNRSARSAERELLGPG